MLLGGKFEKKLTNFFCCLHSIVHFAESRDRSVCEVEMFQERACICEGSYRKDGESL